MWDQFTFFLFYSLHLFHLVFFFPLLWTTAECNIMARKIFFSCNPLYSFKCRHFAKKRMSMLMTIVKHLLHQGRKGHLYIRTTTRFCGRHIKHFSTLLPHLGNPMHNGSFSDRLTTSYCLLSCGLYIQLST